MLLKSVSEPDTPARAYFLPAITIQETWPALVKSPVETREIVSSDVVTAQRRPLQPKSIALPFVAIGDDGVPNASGLIFFTTPEVSLHWI